MKTLNMIGSTLLLSILFYSCDKNEFAPEIANQEFSIAENSPTGTLIGTVAASDGDEGQILSLEIVAGNEDGTFEIDPRTGDLKVADPEQLDYEKNTLFTLTVMVSDDHKKESLEAFATVKINVTDVFEVPPGRVASYPFDGNADDVSGHEHHGTVHGAVLTPDRDGNANSAYYFNGNLAYIDLGNSVELKRYKSDYTVTGWIKQEAYPATYNHIILSNRNQSPDTYAGSFIGVGGLMSSLSKRFEYVQNILVTSDEFTFDIMSSNTQIELNTWYFFAVTYEYKGNMSNTIKIYVDGNFESQKLMGEVIDPEDSPTYLGCEPILSPVQYSFQGCMDDLEIYNRALSEAEIQSLFNK